MKLKIWLRKLGEDQRRLNDEIYVDKCRMQTKERVKRYTEKNKDLLKIKRDEIVKKAKLYDEIVKSIV